jgi:hypothetical protein
MAATTRIRIFDRSNTRIVGSNTTRGIGVGASSMFVLFCAGNDWPCNPLITDPRSLTNCV